MIRHVPTLHREYYCTLWLLWINRKNWRFFTGARHWLPLRIKGQKSDGGLQIWCSIQLSLHKEPTEVGLVKKLTGSLYLLVIRHVPTLYREYYRTLWLWINRKNWRFFTGSRNWLPLWNKGQKKDGRLQIWCSIQLNLHKEPPEVWLVKKLTRSLY